MTETYYAVRDARDGTYYNEYFNNPARYRAGKFEDAKLWKTYNGAAKTAKVWGSCGVPRNINEIIEVTFTYE